MNCSDIKALFALELVLPRQPSSLPCPLAWRLHLGLRLLRRLCLGQLERLGLAWPSSLPGELALLLRRPYPFPPAPCVLSPDGPFLRRAASLSAPRPAWPQQLLQLPFLYGSFLPSLSEPWPLLQPSLLRVSMPVVPGLFFLLLFFITLPFKFEFVPLLLSFVAPERRPQPPPQLSLYRLSPLQAVLLFLWQAWLELPPQQ